MSIHLERKCRHFFQPRLRQVITAVHQADHLGKPPEVVSFSCPQWMAFEELNNLCQALQATNPEFETITVVHGNRSAAEERLQRIEDSLIPAVLNDTELWKDLPSYCHRALAIDGDVETPFSVDESDNPARVQPFLLITCTHRILTSHQ